MLALVVVLVEFCLKSGVAIITQMFETKSLQRYVGLLLAYNGMMCEELCIEMSKLNLL